MNQKLNFEGGPWKLRNNMQVRVLTKKGMDESTHYTSPEYETTVWDGEGNAFVSKESVYEYNKERDKGSWTRNLDFDVMENLDNWKHNRKGVD